MAPANPGLAGLSAGIMSGELGHLFMGFIAQNWHCHSYLLGMGWGLSQWLALGI
jgi:hypothetical protein